MEADWDEVTRIPLPPPAPNAIHTPASAIAFDTLQELLWTGNEYGRITSLHGNELQQYTCYRAHPTHEGPVKQLLICDKGVLSVSARSVHLANRRGLTQWHLSTPQMTELTSMVMSTKDSTEILVAGCQSKMFKVNIDKGTITQTIPSEASYTLMKRSVNTICAATTDGNIHVMDPVTCQVNRVWKAHSGWVNDMDIRSEILITCGWSPRQQQGYMLDHLANVFDLKTLMPLPPLPFPPGAAFVRMHPKMSTTCIVASQTGLMYAVDIMNPDSPLMKHAHMLDTHMLALDIAPSGEALALADAQCTLHLWGSPTKTAFTDYSTPTEFADQSAPVMTMDWSHDTPLNMIGMPYYREQLFSAWPSHLIHEVGAPPARIDPTLTNTSKRSDSGFYAPWPRKTRRNQFEDTRALQRAKDNFAAPKFLSEKARANKDDPNGDQGDRRISDALETLGDLALNGVTRKEVPVIYRNVEIKYSKFGVDDFDFEYYNKTRHSGLETHIANSYANPLLQLIRFVPTLRNLALRHTATSCLYDNCLLCEMGFLSDMLEKAAGLNCQAGNFLKAFSSSNDAAGLGLHEEFTQHTMLGAMIQTANRFLMNSFCASYRQMSPHVNELERALTVSAVMSIRCGHCASEMLKPVETIAHDLVYPQLKMHHRAPRPTFSQILKASVERQDQTRAWCDRCKRYQQLGTRRSVRRVPDVMMLNTAIHNMDQKQLWAIPGWLPREIGIINTEGQFYCYEGQDLKTHLQRGVYDITVYDLIGLVADINSGENQKSHLVAMINVMHSCKEAASNAAADWHLFNDFLVRKMTPDEALRSEAAWKMPCILTYQIRSASRAIDDSWKDRLDPTLLFHNPRGPHEQPGPDVLKALSSDTEQRLTGVPCGIDAEFVALSKAEIDIKADGTRETVRPPRLGLARVSVLRGSGPDEGLSFIDDYIATTDPILDYLTAFSGINPGDLDRSTSRHNLVSLKVAYKKLWLLLNMGVLFVGHGLPKDFRTINIHVPRAQVVDTVDLFSHRVRSQRRLSLRFLAWFLLKEEIQQQSGGHDSVEDALTALKLWKKYKEFVDAGIFESILEEIFDKGRETNFKPPSLLSAERDADTAVGAAGSSSAVGGTGVGGTPGTAAGMTLGSEDGTASMPGTPMRKLIDIVGHHEAKSFASPLR